MSETVGPEIPGPNEEPPAFEDEDGRQQGSGSVPSSSPAIYAARWCPDPTGTFQLRHWDGKVLAKAQPDSLGQPTPWTYLPIWTQTAAWRL